jgi:hypothetical protein
MLTLLPSMGGTSGSTTGASKILEPLSVDLRMLMTLEETTTQIHQRHFSKQPIVNPRESASCTMKDIFGSRTRYWIASSLSGSCNILRLRVATKTFIKVGN